MVKQAVQVVVRTRPTAHFAQGVLDVAPEKKAISVSLKRDTSRDYINHQQGDYRFTFDNVLHNATQEQVYDACARSMVTSALEGYNGTLMCYGQTGAGKTFTMTGTLEHYAHRGIIPRVISDLFGRIQNRPEMAFNVRITYMEIYKEALGDLLSTVSPTADAKGEPLHIVENAQGETIVRGLTSMAVNNEEEALDLLFEGETNRTIGVHQLNKKSSRSHCVFTLHIERRSRVESEERVIRSKLNLVDLAGSERVKKTGSEGRILEEAMHINKSLTFLEQVVIALADRHRDHIPYRSSRLTNCLKDSLGGNCRTLLIANIWAEEAHIEETLSTLRFATRMQRISSEAIVNVVVDAEAQVKMLERQVKDLKQELAMHDLMSGRSHIEYEPYTPERRRDLRAKLAKYVDGETPAPPVESLRHAQEMLGQMRALVLAARQSAGTAPKPSSEKESVGEPMGKATVQQREGVGEAVGSGFGVGVAPVSTKKKVGTATVAEPTVIDPATLRAKIAQAVGNVPPPGQAEVVRSHASSASLQVLDRAAAFLEFKQDPDGGEEAHNNLQENKAVLREAKATAKQLAEQVNTAKQEIDACRALLAHKQQGKDVLEEDGLEIIDEEEFETLSAMKSAKKKYRVAYEELKGARSRIQYVKRLVEHCRSTLLQDFEAWYNRKYGLDAAVEAASHSSSQLLDDQEKFDLLETKRIAEKDPDALAFYKARKSVKRRQAHGKRKKAS